MKKFLKSREGFTLIELLVVIAIIGILAAVVVLAINPVQMMQKSRDSQRKSDISTLARSIDIFMADSGATTVPGGASATRHSYYSGDATPLTCCNGDADATDNCDGTTSINAVYGGWLVADVASCTGSNLANYIAKIPNDPNGSGVDGAQYQYITDASAAKYSLCADMEIGAGSSEVFKAGTNVSLCTLSSASRP